MATKAAKPTKPITVPPAASSPYVNMLIHGDPGAGKTVFSGSSIEIGSVLYLDVEGGVRSIRHWPNIQVSQVRSIREIENAGNYIEEHPEEYDTVCIDSLGELQKLDLAEIMYAAHRANPNQDEDTPSPREWGKSQNHIRTLVRFFRDLPCNTIFTCHTKEVEDETLGRTRYLPNLPGKLAPEIAGFVDIVGFIFIKSVRERGASSVRIERRMMFSGDGRHLVKDRTDKLDAEEVNPTMKSIWAKINTGD